jgi:amino acid transporter
MANNSKSVFGPGTSWIGRGSAALLRSVGVLGVGALGLAGIGLTSTGTLIFSQAIGLWPGVDLTSALAVGLGACLLLAYTYAVIAAAVPRAGADYVLASRVLNGPLAFSASWIFVLFSGLLGGTLLGLFIHELIPLFSQIAVIIFGVVGSQDLIAVVRLPQVIVTVGTLFTLVSFVGLFIPQRIYQRLLLVGVGLGLAAWVVILVGFAITPMGNFEVAWNRAHSVERLYATVIPTARALGFQNAAAPDFFKPGLALGLWAFFGFFAAVYLAGEVRKPENTILGGSWLALLVGGVVFMAGSVALTRAIPAEWLAALSFLSQNMANTSADTVTPWISYYAGLIIPSLPLLLLIFWGWVLAFVTTLQAFMIFMSRIMLAWADDGLLPDEMTYVHPKFRSPLMTLLVAAALVQFGLMIYFAGGPSSLLARVDFVAAAALLVPVAAATLFPFLKKTWFQASPAFVRRKIGPLPLVTLTGGISLVYLLFLFTGPLLALWGMPQVSLIDVVLLLVMLLSGLLWYSIRRGLLRARGVNLDDVTRSLPRSS